MTIASVFRVATGETPYPWQSGLAERNEPAVGITAPTGTGKTEAVVFDWLWRRRLSGDAAQREATPRRLLLTLPMRVLVEQTHRRVLGMVDRLAGAALLDPKDPVGVSVLMGGALDKGWSNHPAADQIIVATIDQALSRALNRGYGRSRGLWPIDFGLVNTDTRWIIDEVQLLDAALATSAQLAGLRANGHRRAASTCWMSATLDPGWLETIDHEAPDPDLVHGLTAQDRDRPLRDRLDATKRLVRMEVDPENTEQMEAIVLEAHARVRPGRAGGPGWLTIAMVNTVARAQALHERLARLQHEFDLVLLHSRFRPADRRRLAEYLDEQPIPPGGRVLVTTQVIEAGVDLDAAALVTELAPWASMVQRAGRLNRAGKRGRHVGDTDDPRLVWLDPPGDLDPRTSRPYDEAQLERCRSVLRESEASSFSPSAIDAAVASRPTGSLLTPPPRGLLLRRRDLLALFDTDPTLDGDDDDVGRFIRLGEDLDLTVAWRADLPAGGPTSNRDMPAHEEQCAVPIRDSKALLALAPWRWSYTERRWSRVEAAARLLPGDRLLIDARRGGYSTTTGWTPGLRGAVDPIAPLIDATVEADSDSDDALSEGAWLTIADHTDAVVAALEADLVRLDLSSEEAEALRLAARWHDAGKAHKTFQGRLGVDVPDLEQPPRQGLWAKAPGDGKRPTWVFRHEVASALLLADAHELDEPVVQLAVYLIGAHHGKLRLTPRLEPLGVRSDKRTCMGVADGDAVPEWSGAAIDLGGGVQASRAIVDLSLFDLGAIDRPTWTEMALDLLARHGAFRLGYLEALLRAADHRASGAGRDRG